MNLTFYHMYCDGGIIQRNPSPYGGMWSYCRTNATGTAIVASSSGVCLSRSAPEAIGDFYAPQRRIDEYQTIENNLMETIAAVEALKWIPRGDNIRIILHSDNNNALERIKGNYAWNAVPEWLRIQGREVVKDRSILTVLLSGHPKKAELKAGYDFETGRPVSQWQEWCDKECKKLGRLYIANLPNVHTARVKQGFDADTHDSSVLA